MVAAVDDVTEAMKDVVDPELVSMLSISDLFTTSWLMKPILRFLT